MSHAMNIQARIKSTIAVGIQIGARTHHQDQSITPIILSTMNTMARSPQKPVPLDEELLLM
jgi:hypothetical protein